MSWTYKYSNDVGPRDDYFVEFWEIVDPDDNVVGRMETETMAALIVDFLNKNTGWLANKVRCNTCSHSWVAVYHSTSEKIECPNCSNLSTFDIEQIPEPI